MKIITETSFEKARKAIKKARQKAWPLATSSINSQSKEKKPVIFSSNNDELNRKILEKEKIDIFLINQGHRKDWQKQRNSGLDQVMAKEAKKNNVIIAINLDEIIDCKEKTRSEIMARLKQNVKICNKSKLNMMFISEKYKKDDYDLKALGLVLGMPTWMLKTFN